MNTLLFAISLAVVMLLGIVPNNGQYKQKDAAQNNEQSEDIAYYVHMYRRLKVNDSIIAANNMRILRLQKQATTR